MYDIVIIGGGVGGLVTASGSAQFGAKVALVEKKRMLGGDCLNYGCVPTKTLIHSSRLYHNIKNARKFGINVENAELDFSRVMARMRDVRAAISVHDDPERFRKMGIDVFFGSGRFKDSNTFIVEGKELRARKFLVSTGSRPAKLPIPGLENVPYLNNESMLELKTLPESMLTLGAGPIGLEYSQMFTRFGCRVTVFDKATGILPREDIELTKILHETTVREGLLVKVCSEIENIRIEDGKIALSAYCGQEKIARKFSAESLFVAVGRSPNIEGLNLEGIGVETSRSGVTVDDTLRTTVPHIYACGDVTGKLPFTHMAEYTAGIVISNALFPLVRRKVDTRVVPWCTFTDPELARVGMLESEARELYGDKIKIYRYNYKDHDRAVIEDATEGLVKLVCDKKGQILGAHILGANAGDLIHEYALAMANRIPVQKISGTIHVYPTMGQIVKRGADQYYREKLFSGAIATFTKFWFGKK